MHNDFEPDRWHELLVLMVLIFTICVFLTGAIFLLDWLWPIRPAATPTVLPIPDPIPQKQPYTSV